MRLISYNILEGGLGRADPIGEILQAGNPDVCVLLEADDLALVDRLANRLHMDYVHALKAGHGGAVLSRFPIRDSINHALLVPAIVKTFLQVTLQFPGGHPLVIFAVHLHAHAHPEDEQTRLRELNAILSVTKPLRDAGKPHLLAGDFNANSPTQRIDIAKVKPSTRQAMEANAGHLPREAIAKLLDAGYIDSLQQVHGDVAARTGTFSTHRPGQRVDYILTHGIPAAAIRAAWVETDRLATYASDHYPVGVELELQRR
jgi:endonuclease/exonuclease/phosphatase family metal-dependent hydrolase